MKPVEVGKMGEERAAVFLESQGFTVLDRNYRFLRNEIDIVVSTDHEIVFVEVKSRRSRSFGLPEESITRQKKRNLIKVAEAWLHERRLTGARVRFDVVTVMNPGTDQEKIEHFPAAFWFA